jgi:predicted dithiol-disulfide oxidoreductase (DUF899 family)
MLTVFMLMNLTPMGRNEEGTMSWVRPIPNKRGSRGDYQSSFRS